MRDYALEERTIGRILADKAATVGERPFLLFEGQKFSYADAHAMTNRYANGFRRAGIGHGDHVAVMLPNCPEFLWRRSGGSASSARSRCRSTPRPRATCCATSSTSRTPSCVSSPRRADRVDVAVPCAMAGPERCAGGRSAARRDGAPGSRDLSVGRSRRRRSSGCATTTRT